MQGSGEGKRISPPLSKIIVKEGKRVWERTPTRAQEEEGGKGGKETFFILCKRRKKGERKTKTLSPRQAEDEGGKGFFLSSKPRKEGRKQVFVTLLRGGKKGPSSPLNNQP